VFGDGGRALYFSKEVIPFAAGAWAGDAPTPVFQHVGVYAYRASALAAYPARPAGRLEAQEGLEQLRFLEAGLSVLCVEVAARGRPFWEVNNPEDVPRVEAALAALGIA
jgi:3-deoxy-manno-octulosonate cytidylyltransferase (CMP-KDO synthetase)